MIQIKTKFSTCTAILKLKACKNKVKFKNKELYNRNKTVMETIKKTNTNKNQKNKKEISKIKNQRKVSKNH